MADVTWPTTEAFHPNFFEMGIRANVQLEMSGYNGGIQTSEIPGSRWVARLQLPENVDGQSTQPVIEAFFAQVRGMANRIVMGHLKRIQPLGTLSGAITSAGAAQGAQSMTLNGTGAPAKGDMLTVETTSGAQWIMVTAVTPGVGASTINFSAPLRAAVAASSIVLYNNTTTRWIVMGSEVMVGYGKGGENPGASVDLMEVWA